ncbi:MAG: M43 family zinc metalloprotease [Flavobacteriales bacterium]
MKAFSSGRSLFQSILFCTAIGTAGIVQAQRTCGSMEYLQEQIAADPARGAALQQADEQAVQYALDHGHGEERSLVIIPVVVHVVWNSSTQNVSDARVMAQIDQLNLDYARANSDVGNTPGAFTGLAANTDIQFCLAQRDPSGNATTGIERRQTTVSSFSTNDNVKRYSNGGLDAWPSGSYLNLWVCNLGSGLLGYAQFPGGPASTDGVAVLYSSVGSMTVPGTITSYKYGRSATHEVGHWMNLRHIWGDDGTSCSGSDQVADTPNQSNENYGCPNFPHVSCSNGPNGDMFMNYMDYSDDLCMNLFTNGQADRMQSVFGPGGARASILNSLGCVNPGGGTTCATPTGLSTSTITSSTASITWNAVSGATSYDVQFRTTGSGSWTSGNVSGNSASLTGLTATTAYEWQVRSNCANGTSNWSGSATFTTLGNGGSGCSDIYEPNASKSAAALIPVNTDITGIISSTTDKDWFKFTTTSAQPNIRIDLTNLPADYDLRLYKGSTSYGSSLTGGTSNEQIVYNGGSPGTYTVKVYGYNKAFNATSCYTLRASVSANNFRESGLGNVRLIGGKVTREFSLYPNPTAGDVLLEYTSEGDGQVEIAVMDAVGKTVYTNSTLVSAGDNSIEVALPQLPNGIYLLRVVDGANSMVQRLVVAH